MKGHCAITEKSHFPVFVAKDAAEGYDKAGDPSGTPLGFMPISGHPIQQSMADRIVCSTTTMRTPYMRCCQTFFGSRPSFSFFCGQ